MNPQTAAQAGLTVAEMLSKYGPWAMCVILIALLVGYYWHSSKKQERQLMALANKCSNSLTTSTAISTDVKEMLKDEKLLRTQVKETLERTTRAVDRCRYPAKPVD
jgi:uncharacterized membrane protein affecting hemolysin expression